jgi:hypothetical protein
VDFSNGSGSQSSTFNPEKYIACKLNNSIAVDGNLGSDELWNLNMDLAYGVTSNEFRAKAGVKWDTNNLYIAAQVTDNIDFNASDSYPDNVLNGDGLEV